MGLVIRISVWKRIPLENCVPNWRVFYGGFLPTDSSHWNMRTCRPTGDSHCWVISVVQVLQHTRYWVYSKTPWWHCIKTTNIWIYPGNLNNFNYQACSHLQLYVYTGLFVQVCENMMLTWISLFVWVQRAGNSTRELQPLRKRRMDTQKFRKQMEQNLVDPETRRLQGDSRRPIPDVIFDERMLAYCKILSPDSLSGFPRGHYSTRQKHAMDSRRLIGDRPEDDFFGQRKCHTAREGIVFRCQDDLKTGEVYEDEWHFSVLLMPGSVAPVVIRGIKDTSGNLIPYDGNDDCIINMGLVKGNIVQQANILFDWAVIQEFFTAISTSPTNFLRFFNTKIHIWCEGIRRHDGVSSFPQFHMVCAWVLWARFSLIRRPLDTCSLFFIFPWLAIPDLIPFLTGFNWRFASERADSFAFVFVNQVSRADFQRWMRVVVSGHVAYPMNFTDPFTIRFETLFRIIRTSWQWTGMLAFRALACSRKWDLAKLFMTIPAIWFNGYCTSAQDCRHMFHSSFTWHVYVCPVHVDIFVSVLWDSNFIAVFPNLYRLLRACVYVFVSSVVFWDALSKFQVCQRDPEWLMYHHAHVDGYLLFSFVCIFLDYSNLITFSVLFWSAHVSNSIIFLILHLVCTYLLGIHQSWGFLQKVIQIWP